MKMYNIMLEMLVCLCHLDHDNTESQMWLQIYAQSPTAYAQSLHTHLHAGAHQIAWCREGFHGAAVLPAAATPDNAHPEQGRGI